jgi:hypothetical protein
MLAEIRARLQASCMPPFKAVLGTTDFAKLEKAPQRQRLPIAYVLPLPQMASANQVVGGVNQRVTGQVAVVMGASSQGEREGVGASDAIETLYRAVRAALIGWQDESLLSPVVLLRGEPRLNEDGVFWWADVYGAAELYQA